MLRQSLRGILKAPHSLSRSLSHFLIRRIPKLRRAHLLSVRAPARSRPLSGYMDRAVRRSLEPPTPSSTSADSCSCSRIASPDRIRFVSRLEVEHAIVEGGEDKGELELEQAYLDFLIDRRFNIRAGQLLVPVGIINERHEPPTFTASSGPSWTPSSSRPRGLTRARASSASLAADGATARLRDGAAQRDGVQRRRRPGRLGPAGPRAVVRHLGGTRQAGVSRRPAPDARHEHLARTDDEQARRPRSARHAGRG